MRKIITLISIAIFPYSFNYAQSDIGKVIQDSYQKINGGNANEAITNLNDALKDAPDNVGALNALALAYNRTKQFDKSLEVYQQVNKLQPQNPRVMFNLGVAHALADNVDAAFAMLMKVKESNGFNITNIGLSPAGQILRDDPRYLKLFPSTKEYGDPFIEDARIIHDWKGENRSDQFGWIGRNIGDVDGDGIMDLTASAPTNSEGGNQAGKIYTYSGKSGKLLWSFASKDEGGQLGMSIEAAGDVNNDGIPDVVAGAPYVNKTWVFSGNNGKVLFELIGEIPQGAFGRGVKGVGDINQDEFDDILIGEPFQIWGAPFNSDQIASAGNVYLYSGKDGSVLYKWEGTTIGDGFGTALSGKTDGDNGTLLLIGAPNAGRNNGGQVWVYNGMSKEPFFIIDADSTGSSLGGMFMSVVGDVNGDGTQDTYTSDFSNTALGNATGRAYIHSGADGELLYRFTGERAGEGFGIGVADAGDINQDGFDDLVIGAWQHASAAPSGGKIYVYSGKTGELMRTLTGKVVGETLGFDTTGIGDVDGDGKMDLLLTSAWSGINDSQSGRMFIVAGE